MQDRQPRKDRRAALKALGLGAGAVALGSKAVHASPRDVEVASDAKPQGYRETEHILSYYATARNS
ncbi:twin-arginine translocation signal domain-containing protein [Ferrimonas gelatinilytica]|uniref:Formate dehydrogenase region TAT target n=1 Tax=Ferrimonas gelatinilytica TaxID=1255257 RepID=A0ABP9RVA5_9GAMM